MLFNRLINKNLARNAVNMAAANNFRAISTSPARQIFSRDPFPPLWPFYDPFRPLRHQRIRGDPFAMLDNFFDDNFGKFQIRDNAAKLSISDKGDLIYQVDVSGFHPEELQVGIEGDDIVVQGEHKQKSEGEEVHRQFTRRVRIPAGIQKDTVKCDIDEKGCLTVSAKKAGIEGGAERKSIPIGVKSTTTTEEAKPIENK